MSIFTKQFFNRLLVTRYIYLILPAVLLIGCATASPQEMNMMENAKAAGAPIFWEDLEVGAPNSANGKQISWHWHNTSGKTIKYASFDFNYYNNVNDPASCPYGAGSSVKQTGPIEPGSREARQFTSLCYDSYVTCGELESVQLEYMDGTYESYSKEELLEMNAIDRTDKCGSEY